MKRETLTGRPYAPIVEIVRRERHGSRVAAAIYGAIAGPACSPKNRGYLRSRPPRDPDARVAWHAITAHVNPYKISVGTVLMFSDEERWLYDAILKFVETNPDLFHGLDKDRNALEAMGVW